MNVTDESALIINLRRQLELLNHFTFSNNEWDRFFTQNIARANEASLRRPAKFRMTMCKSSNVTMEVQKTSVLLIKEHSQQPPTGT